MASVRTDDGSGPDRGLDEVLAAYLEEVESGDRPDRHAWIANHPEIAAELSAFFANLDHVGRLAEPLRTPAATETWARDLIPFPGRQDGGPHPADFGDYRLVRELGRGGMGVVYEARQVSLGRVVALKVILPERIASESDVRRFRRESTAAAGLDHPNIVPIFDVGEHEGRCYYAMKLVDGGNLSRRAPLLRDDPKGAAEVLAAVARAVNFAHDRGVLHRDLKPANILLDGGGRPYVADFGLARHVEWGDDLTVSGSVVGTPAYMAPEQAEGRRGAVTAASDVYGLGAILYELLTGRPPFQGDSVLEVLAAVRGSDPVAPSALNPGVPRDLETIANKCLEKDPRRRYASAAAVADDLERWLDGSPISARPARLPERALKWARRRPATAALAVACVVAAVAAVAAVRGTLNETLLRGEVRKSERHRLVEAETRRGLEAELARRARDRQEAEAAGYADRIAAAERAYRANDVATADRLLGECPEELRRWEWRYLNRLGHAERRTIAGHNGVLCNVAFAPETSVFTCPSAHQGVSIWDAKADRQVGHLRGLDGTAYGVAFDRRGTRLAAAGSDGAVRLWDVATARLLHTFAGHGEWAAAVAFSPDDSRIVSGGADRVVRVWDAATGDQVVALDGHAEPVFGVAFRPGGRVIASAGQDGAVILWDARSGGVIRRLAGHAGVARCVAFSPDGSKLASGGADRLVKVWDVATGKEDLSFHAASGRVDGLAFHPDGLRIATGGLDRSVTVWDATTGRELASYRGHAAPVFSVAFSPDGLILASASQDATVKLWDAANAPESRALHTGMALHEVGGPVFRPGGSTLAAVASGRGVVSWDVATGHERATIPCPGAAPTTPAFHPEGRLVAWVDFEGVVRVSDATAGDVRLTIPAEHQEGVASLSYFPDGSRLVTGAGRPVSVVQSLRGKGLPPAGGNHSVRVWDAVSGQPRLELRGHEGPVFSVAVSPDGSTIASGGADGTVRLWDAETGDPREVIPPGSGPVFAVAFSPGGGSLASAGGDGSVRVRNLAHGGDVVLPGRHGWVQGLAFSPDGSRLASACGDGAVRVWDPSRGRELLALRGHAHRAVGVAFGRNGRFLASAGSDGDLKVWEAPPEPGPID